MGRDRGGAFKRPPHQVVESGGPAGRGLIEWGRLGTAVLTGDPGGGDSARFGSAGLQCRAVWLVWAGLGWIGASG